MNEKDELRPVGTTPAEDEMFRYMTEEQVTEYLRRKEKEI